MLLKTFAIIVFVAIIFSLGTALFHLVKAKDEEHSRKTAKALTFRIGLSLVLFIIFASALLMGYFRPTGIGARIQQQSSMNTEPVKP